jgi:glutathione S-transferase
MAIQPIVIWGDEKYPNAAKVIIVLEELAVPYTIRNVDWADVKKEPYISVNPNGRIPAIQDPNAGITVWEVCLSIQDHEATLTILLSLAPV